MSLAAAEGNDAAEINPDVDRSGREWLVGDDPLAVNDEHNTRVDVAESDAHIGDGWTLPGYSFGILRLPVSDGQQ